MTRFGILALVLLLSGSVTAEAQAERPLADLDLAELMKIEVQSVFGASKFLQKVTEAPAAVSVVTADDIALYGYRTLGAIVGSVPGFNVTNDRNYSYVGVRGFQRPGDYNSRVLVLIDGHRINDPVYDGAYLGTEFPLDVELIDRVELIRGPSSSIYGTNAFLAVVNVITKKGGTLRGVRVSGDAGSLHTGQAQATLGTRFANGVDLLLSGSRYRSGGNARLYFPEYDDPATNDGVAERLDGDDAYRLYGSLSYKGVSFQSLYGSRKKAVPTGAFASRFNDPRFATNDAQGWADLRYVRAFATGWNLSTRAYYDQVDYDGRYPGTVSDSDGSAGPLFGDYAHSKRWGTEVNVETTIAERHHVTGGAEFRDNFRLNQGGFDVESGAVSLDDRRASRDSAVFVEDQFTLNRRLLLSAGLRTDRYQGFGSTTNPRLAVILKPAARTAVKAIWGSAFRAPNPYELYYHFSDLLVANPDLAPETIRTAEVDVERYVGDRYRLMANVYTSHVRGLISQVVTDSGQLQFRNLDSAVMHGFEAEVEAKWGSGIVGRVGYSLQRVIDPRTSQPLVDSAGQLASVNLVVPIIHRQLLAALDLRYVGRVKTLDGSFTRRIAVPNLTFTTREWRDHMTLSAGITNLLNARYGYPAGDEHLQNIIYQDGRTVRIGFQYAWRLK